MSRRALLASVLIVGCGASRAVAPPAEESPTAEVEAPPEPAASSPPEGGPAAEPDSVGAPAWLAALTRAETTGDPRGREVRCVEVASDAAPLHVASCEPAERNAYAPTAVYVGREGPAAITTIGSTRLEGELREIRVSARSATAIALALRPRRLAMPGVELVCSGAAGRCAVIPVELEAATDDRSDQGPAELAVTLEDTTDATVLRVDGAFLPGSLAMLRDGAPLAALFVEREPSPLAVELDTEAELARLFRALQPSAMTRVSELVLVDDEARHETLTLYEPRDHLLRAWLEGPMPDIYEARLFLQLLDAPASGLAVLTSVACFKSPSRPARGGRWPARALGAPVPLGDAHEEILTDLPRVFRVLVPNERQGWQAQDGTVCHGNLCSEVTLLGEPAFLASMQAILAEARFSPATVSITARRACGAF